MSHPPKLTEVRDHFAVCRAGRIGQVMHTKVVNGVVLYCGLTLDAKYWQSADPRWIADADAEHLEVTWEEGRR